MKAVYVAICLFAMGFYALAQHGPASGSHSASNTTEAQNHNHNTATADNAVDEHATHEDEYPAADVSFAELKTTLGQLERIKESTAKYRDVKVALADGYVELGVEVKGMGVHFVKEMEPATLDLDHPPMLVYEKDASAPEGFNLVGAMYILKGEPGPDGQPVGNPFPKSLAVWHRHAHVCMFSKLEHTTLLSDAECKQRGGHLNTLWMVHTWVWKDSPRGVFSPKNPLVATGGKEHEVHTK